MRTRDTRSAGVASLVVLVAGFALGGVREGRGAGPAGTPRPSDHAATHHKGHGVESPVQATPKGWRFRLPPGRREAGREVFIAFECFTCHAVQGETFPAPAAGRDALGPALSGMGRLHPPEYLAEAIIDPNASVAWRIAHHGSSHEKYVATDGRSKMPTYNDVMTIQQLIDLVAYLSSLTSHGTEPQ